MTNVEQRLIELPDVPGIYLFYSKEKELIYVGKATSLKSRVRSYWAGKRTSRPIEQMMHQVENVSWVETDSALEAAILESVHIKKFQPKYNVDGKDDKSWNYVLITKDTYPRIVTMREHEIILLPEKAPKTEKKFRPSKKVIVRSRQDIAYEFGPYPGLNTKEALKILRRIFHFSNCTPGQGRPCLYRQMDQCLGVCTGEITALEYRTKVIRPLVMFLRGEKKRLVTNLEKAMTAAARVEDFEEAARLREQLKALYRIHDVALLNKSFVSDDAEPAQGVERIEGYDISNLGSTGIVGSMVVFTNGVPDKSQYRKFAMHSVTGQSDVDSLEEMLRRRFRHPEWKFPSILLIDGGRPQVNKVVEVMKDLGISIPIVGIAKGPDRKRNDFTFPNDISEPGNEHLRDFVHYVNEHQELLIRVRDEAHRFAISYQRVKRGMRK